MLIEARLLWGEDLLAVVHVAPAPIVRLADFGLPIPGDDQLIVAERLVLLHTCVVREGVALHLRLVTPNAEKLPFDLGDLRVTKGALLGAILHATFLLMAFLVKATPAEIEAASFMDMKTASAALDAHEHSTTDADPATGDARLDQDHPGAPSKSGEAGAAGAIASQRQTGITRRSRAAPKEEIDVRSAEAALAFGMIGIINASGGPTGKSAFADYDGPSATGSIFGTTIDDAIGAGGASLSGWGEGGGGPGGGIEFQRGGSGLCDEHCMGMRGTSGRAGGFGIGSRGGHTVRSPSIRCGYDDPNDGHVGCVLQVNGRLPPEAIQRIVRQSFGRLRGCYEAGLHRNPSLEGRIAVKFVIDREGAVSMASAADHDLPDAEVVACVARGFQSMSFPRPEGGIVTVAYPVTFSN